ncbi:hypothetical protein [Puniceibacterium sp. IMCC21224]|uniref:hypothetical protein n=1 Tax=Puniceibacterium sp. IMCC21224 TaxID=1618204 RepID=UPI00064DFD73|nr:hypothetical protein [Puniceibacterium sp. IMCC21224]KMK68728.1 hypothetical protein IMCC21224_113613 [Puniceibacterium sp. IMCC21224]
MSLIRPEASKALMRWRDVMAGGAVLLLGLYWGFFTGGGLLHWVGYAVALGGVAMILAGLQRLRFGRAGGSGGPGIVDITEGRISYFGPLNGGVVALSELDALSLDPSERPAHWVLVQPGQAPLHIPVTATGADALFDAFATLPGIRTEHMLRQLQRQATATVLIWRSARADTSAKWLH